MVTILITESMHATGKIFEVYTYFPCVSSSCTRCYQYFTQILNSINQVVKFSLQVPLIILLSLQQVLFIFIEIKNMFYTHSKRLILFLGPSPTFIKTICILENFIATFKGHIVTQYTLYTRVCQNSIS